MKQSLMLGVFCLLHVCGDVYAMDQQDVSVWPAPPVVFYEDRRETPEEDDMQDQCKQELYVSLLYEDAESLWEKQVAEHAKQSVPFWVKPAKWGFFSLSAGCIAAITRYKYKAGIGAGLCMLATTGLHILQKHVERSVVRGRRLGFDMLVERLSENVRMAHNVGKTQVDANVDLQKYAKKRGLGYVLLKNIAYAPHRCESVLLKKIVMYKKNVSVWMSEDEVERALLPIKQEFIRACNEQVYTDSVQGSAEVLVTVPKSYLEID